MHCCLRLGASRSHTFPKEFCEHLEEAGQQEGEEQMQEGEEQTELQDWHVLWAVANDEELLRFSSLGCSALFSCTHKPRSHIRCLPAVLLPLSCPLTRCGLHPPSAHVFTPFPA